MLADEIAQDITERKQAEGVLKESEEKFSRAFHSNPHPMSIVTLEEGRYLDVNDSYVQTFGFSREELLGRTTVEMGILKDDSTRRKILQSLKKRKTVKNLEVNFYTKSGREIETMFSGDKMEIGDQTCLLSIVTDITERKQIEHNLDERIKELNCLYGIAEIIQRPGATLDEILQEAVNLIPPSWQYPEVTCARIKLADKEFKTDIFRPSQWRQSADIVVNGQKEGTLEVCYLVKEPESDEGPFLKEERWLINAITERFGKIIERKRAEGALRESEERFSQLYNESPVGYHESDSEGRVIQVNQTELDMLGYTAEEMLGRHVWDFRVETDTSRQAFAAKMAGTMPPGQAFERTYRRKDGTTFPALLEGRYVKDESGQIIGLRSTIQDITERKQAEEKREQLIQELQETLKEVRTLSGLLPICAWCKKLRDDEGYWKSVEQYIGERTKAQFTHGVCPECQSKFLGKRNSNTKVS